MKSPLIVATKWIAIATIFVAGTLQGQMPFKEGAHSSPGEWAAEGTYIGHGLGAFDRPGELKVPRISSPDNTLVALFKDLRLHLLRGECELPGLDEAEFPHLSEVLWSSNSGALAITSSDGGYVGAWRPRVSTISSERVREVKVIDVLLSDFAARFTCEQPGDLVRQANVAAVHWVNGSSQLLLVAEVPNHSSCKDMGKQVGYIVSVPSGQIHKRLLGSQLRVQWGKYLGERFGRPSTK